MNVAIITAAGKSTRLKANVSKQFLNIYGKPVLAHTISSFQNSQKIDLIYVVVSEGYVNFCKLNVVEKYKFDKVKKIIIGGDSRQKSVYNALKEIPASSEIVSIHDGVRPLITTSEIDFIINTLIEDNRKDSCIKGVIVAAPAHETMKKIKNGDLIDTTIPRETVWHAQTPQTFFYDVILKAHQKALQNGFLGTDDSSLVERMGYKVKIVRGTHENIKITTPVDLFLAELIMKRNGDKGRK